MEIMEMFITYIFNALCKRFCGEMYIKAIAGWQKYKDSSRMPEIWYTSVLVEYLMSYVGYMNWKRNTVVA